MTHQEDAAARVLALTTGVWVAPALYAITKLGVPDALKDGKASAAELAATLGVNASALHRVLRVLASVGIFEESAPSEFRLTEAGAVLRKDASRSLRPLVLMPPLGGPEMLDSIKSGVSSFHKKHGITFFEWLDKNPAAAKVHSESMACLAAREADVLLSGYDFSRASKVVDVGGGRGTLLVRILSANPHLKGLLYDRPHNIDASRAVFESGGVAGRTEATPGNFFEHVPSGGDVYVLASILHDWTDDECITILEHCRAAMPPEGRLLILEGLVDDAGASTFSTLLDLVMLVTIGGRKRTADEYGALLASAGLERLHVTATPLTSIIEARPRA
jgi:hypothetical protein